MAKRKNERQSGMTPEALRELERRFKAGENMSGLFSLKTGKPIKQSAGPSCNQCGAFKVGF